MLGRGWRECKDYKRFYIGFRFRDSIILIPMIMKHHHAVQEWKKIGICSLVPEILDAKSPKRIPSFTRFRVYSPPYVDRIWLWVYYSKISIYPIFCLLKGDYKPHPFLHVVKGLTLQESREGCLTCDLQSSWKIKQLGSLRTSLGLVSHFGAAINTPRSA